MRIRVLSDLHTELRPMIYTPKDEDIVVLAGDIGNGVSAVQWIKYSIPKTTPVIYVPGNHEFDRAVFQDVCKQLREAVKDTNIHLLMNNEVVIDRVRFLGGTMWSNFSLFGIGEQWFVRRECSTNVCDFTAIKTRTPNGNIRNWTTDDCEEQFDIFEGWLDHTLRDSYVSDVYDKTVVVTHFVPHMRSIAPRYLKSLLTPYFATNMEKHIMRCDVWIHGHTHEPFDYTLGDTRVICNPRGYNNESREGVFDPYKTIEI